MQFLSQLDVSLIFTETKVLGDAVAQVLFPPGLPPLLLTQANNWLTARRISPKANW